MNGFRTGQIVKLDNRTGYWKVIGHTPRGRVKLEGYHTGIKTAVWPESLSGTTYPDE